MVATVPERIRKIAISTESPTVVPRLLPGAWSPFQSRTYRIFWIASLASNIGTWVHEVGAGWLMTSLNSSPQMVSSVRVAMALPIILLAIPAGALADRVNRRGLLIVVQSILLVTAATISLLTYLQWISPLSLLVLTIVMGIGMVLHVPTWQATIPEIVAHDQIPQAVALGSISFNLARSIGPALSGLLIAWVGTWAAFAINAVSYAFVLAALITWKRPAEPIHSVDNFGRSVLRGLEFAATDRVMRNVVIRVILFVIPASLLWSQLPLIAREQLGWDSRGYGYLVGAVGIGAVAAATWLPAMRRRIGVDQTVFVAMCLFAIGLAAISVTSSKLLALVAMLLMGTGWMMTLTTLNSTAQVTLHHAIRARGMACYLSSMAIGMAIGSWCWGWVSFQYSTEFAELLAAAILPMFAILGLMLPIDARKNATD